MANDPFGSAPVAPKVKFPTMKQLGNGAKKHTAVYAAGTPDEVVRKDNTGRALLIHPVDFEKDAPSKFDKSGKADRWSVDVIVLDGEPIAEVIDKDGDSVYTFPEPLIAPFKLEKMYISQDLLRKQLSAFVEDPNHGHYMLVRLMLLPPLSAGGNKSWVFGGYLEADAKLATEWDKANPIPSLFD